MPEPNPVPAPDPDPVPEPDPDPVPDPQPGDPAEIIVDSSAANNDPLRAKVAVSANWSASASTPGFHGNNYFFASTEAIADAAEFSFYLDNPGTRAIDIWYTAGANRTATAPVVAFDASGTKLGTATINMQVGGKAWAPVGSYAFTKGWNKIVVSRYTTAGFVVIADAIRVTGKGAPPPPPPPNTDPTAADLLALTQACTPVPGISKFKTDESSNSSTVQVCQLNGAIWWRADADVDCDGAADPKCTVDPDYQPETSAKDSLGKFINPVKVPFYVVPLPSNGFDPKSFGIKTGWSHYGSAGAIIYNGKLIYAPYAAAVLLGINPSPINGGVDSGVTYIVFTGANYVDPIEDPAKAASVGKTLASKLLADN